MRVPRSFSKEKISKPELESNPQPLSHISGVMLYHLSYQALWEQGGSKEGMQVLILGAHYIKICFYYGTPLGDDAVTSGTRLDALAIRPMQLIKYH